MGASKTRALSRQGDSSTALLERPGRRSAELPEPKVAKHLVVGDSPPAARRPRLVRHPSRWALTAIVLLGAVLRMRGLTTRGLWRDDAWVALSSRVGIGTAWHMWVTAPGFSLLERTWICLHPGATWWDQIPMLLVGLAAVPVTYLLARLFRFDNGLSLGMALVVAVSPTCVVYSSRLKEYGADFLLACLLLALTESARRQPHWRSFLWLAAASVVSFASSASTLPVIVGCWLALGVIVVSSRGAVRRLLAFGAATAVLCAAVAAVFYRHISPALRRFWGDDYISLHTPAALIHSTWLAVLRLYQHLTGFPGSAPVDVTIGVVCLTVLLLLGLRRRAMLAPALVVATAFIASAFGQIPLGTGRTDEVLYPALLLLFAAGIHVAQERAARVLHGSEWGKMVGRVGGALVLVLLIVFAMRATNPTYPGTDTARLASALSHEMQPGDHIVVGELMRYSWAYDEEPSVRVVFGPDWSTGFSVASTSPDTFIVPSEYYEGGSKPAAWAASMSRFHRIWFVETPPLNLNPTYEALVDDGWRRVTTIAAPGCSAILLERSRPASGSTPVSAGSESG
jgi:hypothetical protein